MKPLVPVPDFFSYRRRKTRVVKMGDMRIGGDHPIRIQSMTTPPTTDTDATVAQVVSLVKAGCEIVRITAPTPADARNLKNIKEVLLSKGIRVPLVADIHFNPECAMIAADYVEKVRINPGNYADAKAFKVVEYTDEQYQKELDRLEERFTPLVLKLKNIGCALRIGTNHGSLSDRILNRYGDTPEGMVESALEFVRICEKNGFHDIVLSMKASNPKVMIAAYRLLAARMAELGMDYPFHLGVTEAGDGEDGRIKSAIGIGSLLADGIGDTIRVSLTEDPEYEVPVAFALAKPYPHRPQEPLSKFAGAVPVENLYHYTRRPTRQIVMGPFTLGGSNTVRLISDFSQSHPGASSLLHLLEEQLANPKTLPPEIIEWPVRTPSELADLRRVRAALAHETSRLAFVGRFEGALALALDGLRDVHAALWTGSDTAGWKTFIQAAQAARVPVLIEGQARSSDSFSPVSSLWERLAIAEEVGHRDLLVSIRLSSVLDLLHHVRLAVWRLAKEGKDYPFHLRVAPTPDFETHRLEASVALGSLLCDGIGDSVQAGTGTDPQRDLELLYNILQGAGVRITKTEFVSCPSCGRTLFDLQSTTERIRNRTGHLKGVKIAIMGCIVNGPGEMADADFGYVGGAPGKVNLYVGKECVEKGIPTEQALDRLVDLIKSHGKWVEPPTG